MKCQLQRHRLRQFKGNSCQFGVEKKEKDGKAGLSFSLTLLSTFLMTILGKLNGDEIPSTRQFIFRLLGFFFKMNLCDSCSFLQIVFNICFAENFI